MILFVLVFIIIIITNLCYYSSAKNIMKTKIDVMYIYQMVNIDKFIN